MVELTVAHLAAQKAVHWAASRVAQLVEHSAAWKDGQKAALSAAYWADL